MTAESDVNKTYCQLIKKVVEHCEKDHTSQLVVGYTLLQIKRMSKTGETRYF